MRCCAATLNLNDKSDQIWNHLCLQFIYYFFFLGWYLDLSLSSILQLFFVFGGSTVWPKKIDSTVHEHVYTGRNDIVTLLINSEQLNA